jgi:hypothetical protein
MSEHARIIKAMDRAITDWTKMYIIKRKDWFIHIPSGRRCRSCHSTTTKRSRVYIIFPDGAGTWSLASDLMSTT